MSILYDEDKFYAEQGDALSQARLAFFCSNFNRTIFDYPINPKYADLMADKLKENAKNGNTYAQFEIVIINEPRIYITSETFEQFMALKEYCEIEVRKKYDMDDPAAVYCFGENKKDISILEKAAELGSSLACGLLSDYYFHGGFDKYKDSLKDEEKSFYYAEKGAEINDFYSCRCRLKLARRYHDGFGVERDIDKAKVHLQKARDEGCFEARRTHITGNEKYSKMTVVINKPKKGCYVATCVYGNYDCPQVWTLRRFRDHRLMCTWFGRMFVKFYYSVSPKIVEKFGKYKWFNSACKLFLDRMVLNLKKKGYSDTCYTD